MTRHGAKLNQVNGLCLRHHVRAARWKHPGMLLTMANVLTFSWPSNDSRNNTALWGKREPPVVEGAGRRRWVCGRVRRGEEKTEKWGQRRWWGIRKGDYQVEEHMERNACVEGEVMGGERLKRKVGAFRISNRVQLSTEREYWENSEVRPPHFNNSNPLSGARRKRVLSRGAPALPFTSAADRITLVPTNDSAYRWISWQVPVKTVRRVTTDGLSASACSARVSAPAQATVKPRANTEIVSKTRAMAHPLRSQPRRTESLTGGLRTMGVNVPSERAQVHAAAQSRLSSSCSVTQTENQRLKNGFCWEHSLTAHRVLNQHVAPTGRRTGSRRRTLLKIIIIIRHSSVKFEIQIKHRFKKSFRFQDDIITISV